MAETHHTFKFNDENGDSHFVMRHWIKKVRWDNDANGLYLGYMSDDQEVNCFVPNANGVTLHEAIRNGILDLSEGD